MLSTAHRSKHMEKILTLDLRIHRPAITWQFTVADVLRSVIGADLLKHYDFIVGIQGEHLSLSIR